MVDIPLTTTVAHPAIEKAQIFLAGQPEVFCPFPSPFAQTRDDSWTAAAREVEALIAAAGPELLSSSTLRGIPLAPSMAGFLPALGPRPFGTYLLWIAWFMLYDDLWCDALAATDEGGVQLRLAAFQNRCRAVLRGEHPHAGDDTLIVLLDSLWRRTSQLDPLTGAGRLPLLFDGLFQATAVELETRLGRRALPLSVYLPLRGHASGQYISFEYERMCHGFAVSTTAFADPAVFTLMQCAANYAVLLNDLHSGAVDRAREDPTRLAAVLLAECGLPEEGMPTVASRLAAEQARSWQAARGLLDVSTQQPGLNAYLDRIELFLGGTAAWHEAMAPRYEPA